MSKPIVRIVFSLVIALVLVVGIYTSVLGASISVGTKSAHAYVGANFGLRYNQSSQGLSSFGAEASDQTGSDCHSDSMINPEDY